jgi:hypothetical protein
MGERRQPAEYLFGPQPAWEFFNQRGRGQR